MIDGEIKLAGHLVCDDRVKASLLVKPTGSEAEHIIEIVEDDLAHYLNKDQIPVLR